MDGNSKKTVFPESIRQKLGSIKWKAVFTGRGAIALGSVVLVCAIVAAVAFIGGKTEPMGAEESVKTLGQSVLVGLDVSGSADNDDTDYFTAAALNRDRVRSEALAVLEQISVNPDVMPDTKDEALTGIAQMTKEMNIETNIESLVEAKGIGKCIAVFSEGKCTVVVKTDGLLDNEVAQILDIVVTEGNIEPVNVKVIES